MSVSHRSLHRLAAVMAMLAAFSAAAAPGDQTVPPLPGAKAGDDAARTRSISLPARGLFVGDQLSDSTKTRLTELVIGALGLRVEAALLVPTGPWEIDGGTHADNELTQARLAALRRFLTERGVDPKQVFVESRIHAKIAEPRLDVQLVGEPAVD